MREEPQVYRYSVNLLDGERLPLKQFFTRNVCASHRIKEGDNLGLMHQGEPPLMRSHEAGQLLPKHFVIAPHPVCAMSAISQRSCGTEHP